MEFEDDILLNWRIDHDYDYWPDKDQMYITYPIIFPTVEIHLAVTDAIVAAVEKTLNRKLKLNEWIEPKITIYGVYPGIENCVVCDIRTRKHWVDTVEIPLSDEQRCMAWLALDMDLRNTTKDTCFSLLSWAAEECDIRWEPPLKNE